MLLVMGVAKMTTIRYGWQVYKLPYMEVFEHFPKNLWSHCAWHIVLLQM